MSEGDNTSEQSETAPIETGNEDFTQKIAELRQSIGGTTPGNESPEPISGAENPDTLKEQTTEQLGQTTGPEKPEGQDVIPLLESIKNSVNESSSQLLDRLTLINEDIRTQTDLLKINIDLLKQMLDTLKEAKTPEQSGKIPDKEAPESQSGTPASTSSQDNQAT